MRFGTGIGTLAAVVAGLVVLVALGKPAAQAPTGRGFSAIPLRPGAVEALRARGKQPSIPFPNSINRGRKFNPGGGVVGQLDTPSVQRVLVILVKFTTTPPGGPADRLAPQVFDDMLFGTSDDPPDYASYAGHPTDRTLYNYYKAVSYGKVDVVTVNAPSSRGWIASGRPYDYYCRPDGLHDYGWGPFPGNAQGLVLDAVRAVDPYVDFRKCTR